MCMCMPIFSPLDDDRTAPMTESAAPHDATHDDLHNSLQRASFVRQDDEGVVFTLQGHDEPLELLVDAAEFERRDIPGSEQSVEVLVERPWGSYWTASVLKAEKLAMYDILNDLVKEQGTLRGTILSANKGGLNVDVGIRGFIPWSHVDLHRVHDPSPYIGREEEFAVIEFDEENCQLVLSRSKLLKKAQHVTAKATRERLAAGEEFEGVVRTIKPYGAFVDVGGVEGLLHVTNMSWARVDQPSDLFRVGDTVRVVVLDYNPKKKRLSLGRKQLLDDPWKGIAERLSEGAVISGKVVSLADYGAFVEVAPGLEGLVHVTELSWVGHVNHPSDVLEIGQEIGVKVLSIDEDGRRLGLSIKQLESNPWETLASRLSEGDILSGRITNITDFGAFVEVSPGIEGLVHISNVSWTTKGITPAEAFKAGETIEVKVLGIDASSERLDLGIKQLAADPWAEIAAIAKPGTKIPVTITRTTDFGAFAEITEGVEGLIHISELREERVENVKSVVRPGQKVDVLVMSVDRGSQRISLSLKRDELDDDQVLEYNDDELATSTLGDILREQLGIAEPSAEEE